MSFAVVRALGTAARAVGMQKIANATGLQRQGLYKSLSDEGNPSFDTILKVMNAVGVELQPKAKPETRRPRNKVRLARKKSPLRAGKAAA
jgi:DNA-binding phage protein